MPAHLFRLKPWEILLSLFILGGLTWFFWHQYRVQESLITRQHTMALDVAYRATLATYRLDISTRFNLQVNQPEVLALVKQALHATPEELPLLRGQLFRLLNPVYEEFKREGFSQFHFHLADDRTLLRFHLPHKTDDALFDLRPTLYRANTEKRMVVGFEVGRSHVSLRHVFPLALDGVHLGSVEISLPFEYIHESLMRLLDHGDIGFFLHREVVIQRLDSDYLDSFATSPIHPQFLIENPVISKVARNFMQSELTISLQPLLSECKQTHKNMLAGKNFIVPLIHNGRAYTATFIAITDVTEQPIAYLVRFTQSNMLYDVRRALLLQYILVTSFFLALALAIHGLRHKQQRLRQDIARRVKAEAGLRLYENVFRHSGEAILITDQNNCIIDVNPAFTRLTGYTRKDIRGKNPRILKSKKTPPETYKELWIKLSEAGFWQGELWDQRKDGSIYPKWVSISLIHDHRGKITHHIASFVDISERKAAEARIERLAHHDLLTGLFNRYSLENHLEHALLYSQRNNQQLAVVFIDMDRFKVINDTLGHSIGDCLLQEVAKRLQDTVRSSDIVARQGGDEFVVILPCLDGLQSAAPVVHKILGSLAEPYKIEGHILHSSPSIGVSMYPEDGKTADALMKNADTAMYHAKEQGRNNVQFFTHEMTRSANERLALENDLRLALGRDELSLFYQPKVRADTLLVCGFEALLRWRHPHKGFVSPDIFVPIAEEAGLIEEIGVWVLDQACAQMAAWYTAGFTDLHIAVNLSAHQLRSARLVSQVQHCMAQHRIRANTLELEITESVAMESPEQAINQLQRLRDLGVKLAIDDFGTGYSSLAYLKHLPIQVLKLDRSFVSNIETDVNNAAISAATVALAHTLGLEVVAEGVETEKQRDILTQQHGCDYLQGYLFSRPQPADQATEYLQNVFANTRQPHA